MTQVGWANERPGRWWKDLFVLCSCAFSSLRGPGISHSSVVVGRIAKRPRLCTSHTVTTLYYGMDIWWQLRSLVTSRWERCREWASNITHNSLYSCLTMKTKSSPTIALMAQFIGNHVVINAWFKTTQLWCHNGRSLIPAGQLVCVPFHTQGRRNKAFCFIRVFKSE